VCFLPNVCGYRPQTFVVFFTGVQIRKINKRFSGHSFSGNFFYETLYLNFSFRASLGFLSLITHKMQKAIDFDAECARLNPTHIHATPSQITERDAVLNLIDQQSSKCMTHIFSPAISTLSPTSASTSFENEKPRRSEP
jgi:hypothetical protein